MVLTVCLYLLLLGLDAAPEARLSTTWFPLVCSGSLFRSVLGCWFTVRRLLTVGLR